MKLLTKGNSVKVSMSLPVCYRLPVVADLRPWIMEHVVGQMNRVEWSRRHRRWRAAHVVRGTSRTTDTRRFGQPLPTASTTSW